MLLNIINITFKSKIHSMQNIYNKLHNIWQNNPWDDEPHIDKDNIFIKNKKKNFKPNFDNFNFNFNDTKLFLLAALILLFAWLSSGFYKINEGEQAAVLRFGKYNRTAMPGLNYHLPTPFEKALIEKVEKARRVEIGFRNNINNSKFYKSFTINPPTSTSVKKDVPEEALMLTGDENIVEIQCVVMWRIDDIMDYVFNVSNPQLAIKTAAESAIREVIANSPISHVTTNKKAEIIASIEELTQKILDSYQIGVVIDEVQLLKSDPPPEVIDAFRDVQTARADKEREINQGEAYRNDILPKARGKAAKLNEEAEAYRQKVITAAEGEISRFNNIYKEYINNKEVMRDRLYLDTIEKILTNSNKVIIDNNQILPHMAINKD